MTYSPVGASQSTRSASPNHLAYHLAYLDGLRALAALAVVCCHARLPNWDQWPLGFAITNRLRMFSLYDNLGHFAVDLFIVLSGFCLMLPVVRNGGVLRGGAGLFFKKRAIRILPPYFAAMAVSLLLIVLFIGDKTHTPWDASLPVGGWDIIANLFLLQNFSMHPGAINHAHWSISLEWWIYFLFPAMILLWRGIGPLRSTLISLAASAVIVAGCLGLFGKGFTLQYVGLFALGMLGAKLAQLGAESSREKLVRGAGLLALIALTIGVLGLSRFGVQLMGGTVGPVIIDYFVGIWAMTLLVYLALTPRGWLRRALSLPPLVFVGTFAYSIYLIHAPLLQILWQYGLDPLGFSPLTTYVLFKVSGISLAIAVGYVFYRLAERPFIQIKQGQAARTTTPISALSNQRVEVSRA
jgi:peptidoglycan/LPS O-acetylase OafA/YrhL